ncbi:MAG: translation initiation factor IF-3 [Syntrophales bacterium]|nr:translation initiation factor IF-3 [Syntrophales bacterium]MDD5643102.1 translation initiation factor IF-3 [Syntrophales bacterium]
MRINEQIKVPEIRLIGPDGQQIGVMPVKEALARATEANLDLVEVAPQASPPVCRIMDYGKYKYQQSKKQQEARRRQTTIQVKEVKVRPKIETHDMDFKMRNARRFLSEGDKVKISVIFRGREIAHTDRGFRLLARISETLADVGTVEQHPKLEGRNLSMIVTPKQ